MATYECNGCGIGCCTIGLSADDYEPRDVIKNAVCPQGIEYVNFELQNPTDYGCKEDGTHLPLCRHCKHNPNSTDATKPNSCDLNNKKAVKWIETCDKWEDCVPVDEESKMSIKPNKQYWLASISERDFTLDFERVEVLRYHPGDSRAVVVRLCEDGTVWSSELRVVSCNKLFTDLKEALRQLRTPIANLLHNIDDFLNNRVIGENGVMGELHVPADREL